MFQKYNLTPKNYIRYFFSFNTFFNIGVILLPTAPFLAAIFILISSFKILKEKKNKFNLDKWDFYLIFISILMIISCLFKTIFIEPNPETWSPYLSWIGLFNFLPFFYIFWASQIYLNTIELRIKFSKLLIIGTVPLLVSIGMQYCGFFGPYTLLKGMITWHNNSETPYAGVFKSINYLGAWLSIIWPLSYCLIFEKSRKLMKKFFMIFLTILIITALLQTFSRAAWLNLIISLPFIIEFSKIKWFLPLIISYVLILFTSQLSFVPTIFKSLGEFILPQRFILRLRSFPRLEIWESAITLITEKPILGWGAASFPILYEMRTGNFNNHTHNLFLEIAINYGSLVSILLFFLFLFLLIKNFKILQKKIKKKNKNNFFIYDFDKSWLICGSIFVISHLVDVQYYDLRISLLGWLLFTGIRVINKESNQNVWITKN